MTISAFDLFKVGIGPSSSHTVGPMRAAGMFAASLAEDGVEDRVTGIRAELFGSLGATGHGHGSVKAIVLGLSGERPETVDPEAAEPMAARVAETGRLRLPPGREIAFDPAEDIVLHRRRRLPFHSNAMRFAAVDEADREIAARIGPTVCELDGPMPILKRSKALIVTSDLLPLPDATCRPGPGCPRGRRGDGGARWPGGCRPPR